MVVLTNTVYKSQVFEYLTLEIYCFYMKIIRKNFDEKNVNKVVSECFRI